MTPEVAGHRWVVHKFGGTSLADAARYARATALVRAEAEGGPVAVVVSAPAGVTDALLGAVELAAGRDAGYRAALGRIRDRMSGIADELLGPAAGPVARVIRADAADLEDVLRGVELARSAPEQTRELVSGFGEVWSARILHAHLAAQGADHVDWLDAREVLVVRRSRMADPVVLWDETRTRLAAWRRHHPCRTLVATGYVAADESDVPTSLGRNGSDFSASILARLLDASEVTIWTDVQGVMSADPRLVPEAVLLPRLSYHEAAELAWFGARVLHPHALAPVIDAGIPVHIRDAAAPHRPGTVLGPALPTTDGAPPSAVKGFSSSAEVALLNLEGVGLAGVPGVAERFFGALRDVGVSVVMISQAGSEHSICAAVPTGQAAVAREAVERAFHAEIHHGQVQTVEVDGPYCILAAVGDAMARTPGVAARFFGALGSANINVRAIAQGSSERNISAAVATRDSPRALRAVHAGFYLSDRTLSVGLLGPGRIGSELLSQVAARARVLHERFRIDLRVRGIMRSDAMLLDERGIDLDSWPEALGRNGEPPDLERFVAHVNADHIPHAVLVDCTAATAFDDAYPLWLDRGIHVVTANKHATSSSLELYRRIREPSPAPRGHYLGSATVGAGLPVIRTLQDLVRTGDRVRRIEGILSGTLSYLFNGLSAHMPFSRIVEEAYRRGYTEPDPREDLSGMDVVRKALILGRETGLSLEPSDVVAESLVPESLREGEATPESFLERLAEHDPVMEVRRAEAEAAGAALRYVARVDADGASVGLRSVPTDHPFFGVGGADAIVAFTTDRYHPRPLVIQGPGAGPGVTAGGVFADLLRLAGLIGGADGNV